ncbi:MAG: 16S rRNA (cytosine(1402)-N(4))-methyltransferase RsmH [Patescibacteria group bacterium]
MHIPVLLKETIEGLMLEKNDFLVDATFGLGGHSKGAYQKEKSIKILGIDLNRETLEREANFLKKEGCWIEIVVDNFKNIDKILDNLGKDTPNKYIFDLGWSSEELEESQRGFSFLRNEPLLMTFKSDVLDEDLTAREIVNVWEEKNLEAIIRGFGEEQFSKKIAKAIVEGRKKRSIETTLDLVSIIAKVVPTWYKHKKTHFATKTFQAIRMATNDEVESLKVALEKSFNNLKKGGRIAVITFHSIEDRIVKNFYKGFTKDGGRLVNKKPITPTREEIKNNKRARSAKLRIIEKI